MIQKFLRFLMYLLLFSLVLLAIWEFGKTYIPQTYQYKNVKFILLFYTIFMALFHFGALQSNEKSGTKFMHFYMFATIFKLLILIGVIVLFALANPEQAIVFVIYFFSAYLLYTAFETTVIFKFLK